MDSTSETARQLDALAKHLLTRKEELLACWRRAVEADPQLTTHSSLPRTQFYDHIPYLLEAFVQRLITCIWQASSPPQNGERQAAEHGLQRWQHGYQPHEVTREWSHLHVCLVEELEAYAVTRPAEEAAALVIARRELASLISDGVSESIQQFCDLQRKEALGQARTLERSLEQLQQLDRQRAELWRQAAHDLRGNVGAVSGAARGVVVSRDSESQREQFLTLLDSNMERLRTNLEEMMSLARLQAGREERRLESIDVAALLAELCRDLKPLADEKGLALSAEGAERLDVQSDGAKLRRIAQNLLLNAIKYTQAGGVTVSWGDSRAGDPDRWMLTIRDTGPGFSSGSASPLADVLEQVTDESHQLRQDADQAPGTPKQDAPPEESNPVESQRGEGVGLAIVMRLCELLDAAVELQSSPEGAVFRILFPRRYH